MPNASGPPNAQNRASHQNARQENSRAHHCLGWKPIAVRKEWAEPQRPNSGNRYVGHNARAHTGKGRTH